VESSIPTVDEEEKSMTKIILTEKEASEYIGMSRSFLRQDRMNGYRVNRTPGPPFIKIGRSIRYLKTIWINGYLSIELKIHLKYKQGQIN
jgi:hypothetical protein